MAFAGRRYKDSQRQPFLAKGDGHGTCSQASNLLFPDGRQLHESKVIVQLGIGGSPSYGYLLYTYFEIHRIPFCYGYSSGYGYVFQQPP